MPHFAEQISSRMWSSSTHPARAAAHWALSGLPLAAQEAGLVRVSDSWRYFKGTNAPSAPASAWRQPAFDDSTWGTATGAFVVGHRGNGDAAEL